MYKKRKYHDAKTLIAIARASGRPSLFQGENARKKPGGDIGGRLIPNPKPKRRLVVKILDSDKHHARIGPDALQAGGERVK